MRGSFSRAARTQAAHANGLAALRQNPCWPLINMVPHTRMLQARPRTVWMDDGGGGLAQTHGSGPAARVGGKADGDSDMAGAAGASERGASMVNETHAGIGMNEDGRGPSMVNETYASGEVDLDDEAAGEDTATGLPLSFRDPARSPPPATQRHGGKLSNISRARKPSLYLGFDAGTGDQEC